MSGGAPPASRRSAGSARPRRADGGLPVGVLRALAPRARRRLARWLLDGLPMEERAFLVETLLAEPVVVETPHGPLRFLNHGRGSLKRARTLLTKEPDSLRWIDAMAPGSVFWDLGANVGTLSLYAARRGDLEVWAFEPAAVNYYNLAANCELNGLSDSLHCLLAAFGAEVRLGAIRAAQAAPAQSFTFHAKRKGRAERTPQPAAVHTVDRLIADYGAPTPNYLKIDVPGMTLDILTGAEATLADPRLKQLQVEAKEEGRGGRRVAALLAERGFRIVARNRKKGGTVQGDLVFGRAG